MSEDQKASSMLADIYREVGETKVNVENVSKKLDNHIDNTVMELRRINELDTEQNRILDKHIEGVNTLKDMHVAHRVETITQIDILKQNLELQRKEVDARMEAIEKPFELVKYAGKVLIWVGSAAGAIAAIIALFGGL